MLDNLTPFAGGPQSVYRHVLLVLYQSMPTHTHTHIHIHTYIHTHTHKQHTYTHTHTQTDRHHVTMRDEGQAD